MPQLLRRILSYLRRNVIAFLALFFAIGAGGGYAIAATSNKTIHGCVNKRTHALYVQQRCGRGQSALTWNQQGRPSPSAWAAVQANGFLGAGARGISVQHVSTGTYNVTATPSACTQVADAPTVTVDTAAPTGAPPVGAFPVNLDPDALQSRLIGLGAKPELLTVVSENNCVESFARTLCAEATAG
jgi:hypothetical protein